MAEEREKTNPDYPVTPAWRPASNPGVRLPAPSLEPVRPSSQGVELHPPSTQRTVPEADTDSASVPRSYAPPTRWADEPARQYAPATPLRHSGVLPGHSGALPGHYAPATPQGTVLPIPPRASSQAAGQHVPPMPPQPGRGPSDALRASPVGYSVVPASQESIRPAPFRPVSAPSQAAPVAPVAPPAPVQPPSRPNFAPASPAAAPGPPQPVVTRPSSAPTFRPASDGYVRPDSGVRPTSNSATALRPASGFGLDLQDTGAGAAASRRAADPTRLLPWLRDKNKQFKALTVEECDAMFKFASLHRLEAHTIMQAIDAPPTACFAITTGAVVARIRRPNGAFRELDRYGPGEIVGLLALVDGKPSPYEIHAASAVEVIAFEADKLAQYVAALHPDALLAVRAWTPMLIEHLRSVQQRVGRLASTRRARVQARDDDEWKAGKG